MIKHLYFIEGAGAYEGIFYAFRYMPHIGRNSSIFFEPGAYQLFINAAIYILFFSKTGFTPTRSRIYFSILIITLLTTQSTTGFMIFMIMLLMMFAKSDFLTSSGKIKLVLFIVLTSIIFAAQFRVVMVEKFEKFFAIEHITDTRDRRSFDTLVDIEIIKKNIFGVGQIEYGRKFSEIGKLGKGQSSSNGVTKTLAIYGLPFSLFLLFSYAGFFIKYHKNIIMRVGGIIIFIIFIAAEAYYVFSPILLSLISALFIFGINPGKKNKEALSTN